MASKQGLFVGLTTLDCLYQADSPPAANEKVVAHKSLLVAGGPATNAAVAFAQLGEHQMAVSAHIAKEALLKTSRSASFACQYWGTRDWIKIYRMDEVDETHAPQ
jgi:hypothetical protein